MLFCWPHPEWKPVPVVEWYWITSYLFKSYFPQKLTVLINVELAFDINLHNVMFRKAISNYISIC